MQRRRWWAVALGGTVACAWVAGATSATSAACAAGAVARVADGKTTCVAASTFRVVRAPASPGATAFRDTLAMRPVGLREKNGTPVPSVISAKLAAKAQVAYVQAETKLIAAIRAAGPKRRTSGRAQDDIRLNMNADGTGSGSITRTVASEGGSLSMELEIGARKQGNEIVLDLGLKATLDDGEGKTTSRGFRLKDLNLRPTPDCPSATGAIDLDEHFGLTQTSADTYGSQRVKLAQVREAVTVGLKARVKAQMGPDARLEPYTLSADVGLDYSRSGSALAFFSAQSRAVGTGRLTATVNPASGALSGASVTTNVRVSGFDSDGAKAKGEFQGVLEKMLKDQAGSIQAKLKTIEQKARGGGCTKLVFSPGSPAQLAPKESKNVGVRLQTTGGAAVQTVRWAAVAAKGSASPGTSKAAEPTLAVKGAAKGPQTAVVNVKAVSPAGISQGSWIGVSKEEAFPPAYRGTATLKTVLGPITETWTATVNYTRTSQKTNPDGSKQAAYRLVSASVGSHTGVGACRWSTSDPNPAIKAGDIEIRVSAAGKWTAAFLLDLQMRSASMTCPPAPATPFQPKAFLSSRGTTGLRPLAARGPIEASNVEGLGLGPSTASWRLAPGS